MLCYLTIKTLKKDNFMKTLQEQVLKLQNELIIFDKVLKNFQQSQNESDHKQFYPIAILEIFKKCYDLFEILIKEYNEKNSGLAKSSAKILYEQALKNGLIDQQQLNLLFHMIEDRKQTQQRDKEFAVFVDRLIQYYALMDLITRKIV